MKIRPLGKRVLVKQVEQEEVTKSGIVLPGTVSKEKPITEIMQKMLTIKICGCII